jgi:hypothetical protein
VDAHGPGIDPEGAWYDEMLVSGDVVIVIGHSRAVEGTEVGLFRIDAAGGLRRASTYHLRASDPDGPRDFGIRLAGGRLVFYAPLRLGPGEDAAAMAPALRRWSPGAPDGAFRPVAPERRPYRPARPPNPDGPLVLHSVTVCGVARAELDCAVTTVLGPQWRAFHVSSGSLFFWTEGWRDGKQPGTPDVVYRVPLDGSAPSALGVEGSPIDELSFLESADGHLNVLVRGEWTWSAEWANAGMAMLRLPLAGFGDGTADASRAAYRPLPAPGLSVVRNRFVGRHLLYSVESGWEPPRGRDAALHVVEWSSGRVERLALPHGVESGILGVPVRARGVPGREPPSRDSASVLFLRSRSLELAELGALSARADGTADDGCGATCVDWFGNARPIFFRGRVFALLGYELVEGELRGGRIREVRRTAFGAGN